MTHRYFIKVSFDGTDYSGWQAQKNAAHTVQQKINDGLSTLLNEKIEVQGCCRTDAGVHANGLFAHFDSKKSGLSPPLTSSKGGETSNTDWLHKFNSILPADISIHEIFSVGEHAHARFDATARTYQYYIHNKRNPFLINRSYYYYSELDIALMNKAGKILKKYEDFSSFSKMNTQAKTNKCKIFEAEWQRVWGCNGGKMEGWAVSQYSSIPIFQPSFFFTIRADRFLRGMVRMIVGTMMLIGKHKITLSDFEKIIQSKDCRNAGVSVPACGLYLTKVEYPKKIISPGPKGRKKQNYYTRFRAGANNTCV